MKSLKILFLAAIALCATYSCKTPTVIDNVYATQTFGVECLDTDLDGTQTMRAWGKGKNKAQAIETAKKNAVKAVLFDGVVSGSNGCNQRPVIGGANALEKNSTYFNRFFTDGGQYREFVSMTDEKRTSRVKSSDKSIENWGVVVRVDREALRNLMIKDGIINP